MTHIRDMYLQDVAARLCVKLGERLLAEPNGQMRSKVAPEDMGDHLVKQLKAMNYKPYMDVDIEHKLVNGWLEVTVKRIQ